jgi:hypothetical protein
MKTIIIGLCLIIIIGFACQTWQLKGQLAEAQRLPSVADIQRRLKDMGYKIKVDGLVSPDWRHSETQLTWDLAVSSQIVAQWNYMYEDNQ